MYDLIYTSLAIFELFYRWNTLEYVGLTWIGKHTPNLEVLELMIYN